MVYVINRVEIVNEEVPRDIVNVPIYNYVSSNYKPCSWNQLGEKFFKNEKKVSSMSLVIMNDLLSILDASVFQFILISSISHLNSLHAVLYTSNFEE